MSDKAYLLLLVQKEVKIELVFDKKAQISERFIYHLYLR